MKPASRRTQPSEAATGPSPSANAGAKEDLKSLPLEEVERRLDSSPDGLSQAECARTSKENRP
jgi:H+-transporting ATPase